MDWIVERRPCVGEENVSAKDGREPKKSPFIGATEVAIACYSYEPRHVPGFFIWYAFYDFSRATSLASASLCSHQIEAACMLIDLSGWARENYAWRMVRRARAAKSIVRFLSADPKADWRGSIRCHRNFHYTMHPIHESTLYDIGILIRLEARGRDW